MGLRRRRRRGDGKWEGYPPPSRFGEHCELPQWGLGIAPAANEFWCNILSAKKHARWAVVAITGSWLHITPSLLIPPPWGATPMKISGPQNPPTLWPKVRVVVQTFPSNRPWKGVSVSKSGFKILGAPQINLRGLKLVNFNIQTSLAQGSKVTITSNFYKW